MKTRKIKKNIKLALFVLIFISVFILQTAYAQEQYINKNTDKHLSIDESGSFYKTGPADVLNITVYDNPDLSGNFTVSPDGSIVFPLIGQTMVSGLTIGNIKDIITGLLEKDYLYNPIVSVTVKEYRSKKVRVLGNVGKPGIYYLDRPMRFFDLLSKAEGIPQKFMEIKKGHKARIIRQNGKEGSSGKGTVITIDLYDLLIKGEEEANILLKDGDVIYILQNQSIYVIGEVKKSGSFPYDEGMTVLKAITLAGGVTTKASAKNTVVKRITDNNEVKINVRMSDLLQPEDIVEVPLSFW